MKSVVELTVREVTPALKLTRIQFILMKIVEILFMNPSENELHHKKVQRRLSRICFFLGKKGIRTLAQAIAKDGLSTLINSLHRSYSCMRKNPDNITFCWKNTIFLAYCGEERTPNGSVPHAYCNVVMEAFYWLSNNHHDIFKDAFMEQVDEIFGDHNSEAHHDIGAAVWKPSLDVT